MTIPALREHLDQFAKPAPDELIFTGVRGSILRRSNFRHAAEGDVSSEKIGFPGLHFHDLRRTCDTIAASSGASPTSSNQDRPHRPMHVDGKSPVFRRWETGLFLLVGGTGFEPVTPRL
ncbi:hypothetical protein [Nonomuraea candida]|uniref:hypothetical protein n=1 Tax=Nonomuraea candida TaxID=359159 RepID=UPI0012F9C51C|nr:hypothetical protein [Nonomuraea candida]